MRENKDSSSDVSKKIAIIAAVDFELIGIAGKFGINTLKYLEPVSRGNIILCISGVGITNAATATTIVAERFSPGLIISTGIGGSYAWSGLKLGDVAIAEQEIYADTGLSLSEGLHDMRYIGFHLFKKNDIEFFNEIPVTKKYLDNIIEVSRGSQINIKSGNFVTVCQVSGDFKVAEDRSKRYNAICENMEGAAVGHVATVYGIDFIEIRGISNFAGERDKERWNIKLAAENCQKVLIKFILTLTAVQ